MCNDLTVKDCYVGHATDFRKRKNQHKTVCHDEKRPDYNFPLYQCIRQHDGWDNWSMVPIQQSSCINKLEALAIERALMEELNAMLNVLTPGRTRKEYRIENKELIADQKKRYADTHKEHIQQYQKKRYENQKETILEQNKQYREAHKEKLAEQHRKYLEEHKTELYARKKERYDLNKEQINERQRQKRAEKKKVINKKDV